MATSTKPKPLVINNFQKGVAESPYFGHSVMSSVDNAMSQGALTLNFRTYPSTGSVDGYLKWIVTNPTNIAGTYNTIGVTSSGKVYYYSGLTSNLWTLISGNGAGGQGSGMAAWKGYTFVANDATGYIDVLHGITTWTNNWGYLSSNQGYHMMLVGQDDILYVCDGRWIISIQEKVGQTFDPGNSGTYTYSQQALDLPSQYQSTCLAELGVYLMIGTNQLAYGSTSADIFPWDRTSPSFDLPIRIGEAGVWQMITRNLKSLYDLMRESHGGADYSNYYRFLQYPWPGAICNYDNKILFGTTYVALSGDTLYPVGVWGIDQNDAFTMEYALTPGDSFSTSFGFGAITKFSIYNAILASMYVSGTSYNEMSTDSISTDYLYKDYTAYVESQYFLEGTKLVPRTFQQLEFLLGKPLGVGQGIRIKYRKNLASNWTTFGTYDYATIGGVTSHNISFAVTCEAIQFRIELTSQDSIYGPEFIQLLVF